jgi:hypothetical protein
MKVGEDRGLCRRRGGEKRNPISVGGLGCKSKVLACLRRNHTYHRFDPVEYTGLLKKKYTLSKINLQKLLTLNPCPVYGWKGNLSKF